MRIRWILKIQIEKSLVMVSLLTVNIERGELFSLSPCCQVSQILSCQVKLTTSRQDEEGGPAKLNLPFLPTHSLSPSHARMSSNIQRSCEEPAEVEAARNFEHAFLF